jgi:hypothetical protein
MAARYSDHTPSDARVIWGAIGILLGTAAQLAAATYAKVRVLGMHPDRAFAASLRGNVPVDFFGEIVLLVPFAVVGMFAVAVHGKRGPTAALATLLLAVLPLQVLYAQGFVGAERCLQARKWTAASLSLGFLPVAGLFVVAVVCGTAVGVDYAWARRGAGGEVEG